MLQLAQADGKTTVNELWFTPKMRVHIGNAIRIGDRVYGSSGDFGPAFVTAVDVRTGEVAWQERGFARATFVYADGKLVLLDEDGTLALVTPCPERTAGPRQGVGPDQQGLDGAHAGGDGLYLRDRATIKALELGGS